MITPKTTMREFGVNETETLLEAAAKAIRKAAGDPDEEAVHKMRVSIRRFQQSIRLFAQFFPAKGVRQIRSDLKSVMIPAGELRNCDIAIGLAGPRSAATRTLTARRQEAQEALAAVLHELDAEGLAASWKLLLLETPSRKKAGKKLWRGKRTVGDNLRRNMTCLARDYLDEGDTALQPGRSWEELHHFRLITKRFRYTLELLRPAYGRSLETRIELLRSVQTLLGDMNDAIVTTGVLTDLPGTQRIRARLASKAEKLTHELRKLWTAQFAAPARRLGWPRYLTQYACRTRPAAPSSEEPVTTVENVTEDPPKPPEGVVY